MKGKKIMATLVVLAMVFSTIVVLNKVTDIKIVEEASATTLGIDLWEWDGSADNQFLNTSLDNIYYDNTLDIYFNGSQLTSGTSYYLYYPIYSWSAGTFNTTWRRYQGTAWINIEESGDNFIARDVNLHTVGPWFISDQLVYGGSDSRQFDIVNMANRSVYNSGNWHSISGMFWVNATVRYTGMSISPSSVYYDKNESVTITITGVDTNEVVWVDFRKDDTSGPNDDYVVKRFYNTGPVLTLTGSNIYDMTHQYGAGTYNICVYKNVVGADVGGSGPMLVYGGDTAHTGFNKSFGNATAGDGWESFVVYNSTTQQDSFNEATYNWSTCGPFDPPEYVSWSNISHTTYNLTVLPGRPTMTVTNGTQFWNDTGERHTSNEVKISVKDYDGNNISASSITVALYNRSNNPLNSGATNISWDYFNITINDPTSDTCDIIITPNMTADGTNYANRWGWNATNSALTRTWAPKGKVYVLVTYNSVGNETEDSP